MLHPRIQAGRSKLPWLGELEVEVRAEVAEAHQAEERQENDDALTDDGEEGPGEQRGRENVGIRTDVVRRGRHKQRGGPLQGRGEEQEDDEVVSTQDDTGGTEEARGVF